MDLLSGRHDLEAWSKGLAAVIEWLLPQRRLFELLENNENAIHALAQNSAYFEAHADMHRRVDEILSDGSTPLADRVRIAAAIGVFAGVLGLSGQAFRDVPIDELLPQLVAAVNDVLQVG